MLLSHSLTVVLFYDQIMSIQSPVVVTSEESVPFYRDVRVTAVLAQIVFAVALIALGWFLYRNVSTNLNANGRTFSWNFLNQTAGFEIAEGPAFAPSDTYRKAFIIGAINTLRVAGIGIVLAFGIGLLVGIARLGNNWLLRILATIYVEIIRNTPLLVQLFFWYFGVILALPDIKDHMRVPGLMGEDLAVISNRGIQLAWPFVTATGSAISWWLLAALVVGLIAAWFQRRKLRALGKLGSGFAWGTVAFVLVALVGYFATIATGSLPSNMSYDLRRGDRGTLYVDTNANQRYDDGIDTPMRYVPVTLLAEDGKELGNTITDKEGDFQFFELGEAQGTSISWQEPGPVAFDSPELQGFNVRGGLPIKPEYAGLLLGLIFYTAAFISEIVRAGINAVPRGQWEASRALGLSFGETLRMVVLPQALRVAIPPLTSQFLNLTKNSSLALAVGYPDLFSVSQTITNQSGAELQVILLLMGTYLFFSLCTSGFTNWYNRRMMLKER